METKSRKKLRKDGPRVHPSPAASSSSSPMLPPCRICGEKASGFHYGVNTCEACKAFFRRNLDKGGLYRCIDDGKCEILPGKRNSCAACRFNKCIALGMCKEAIKTGRYTHEKKAEDIKEVKRLEGFQTDPTMYPETVLPQDYAQQKPLSPRQPSSTQLSPKQSSSPGESPHTPPPPPLSSSSSSSLSSPSSSTLALPMQFLPDQTSPKVVSSSVSESDEELQKIIDSVVQSLHSASPYTPEYFRLKPEREQKYLEENLLQQEVFGQLNPLPKEEYNHILQVTGIDADGRKEMFQSEIPHLEQAIKRFITFAKSIPGFSRVCMDDQITIIKNGKFEAWMFLCHSAFNTLHRLYCNQSGRIVGFDEMTKLNSKEFVEAIFAIQSRIQKLMLTQEELCLVGSLAIMLTDDCIIKDIAVTEESQRLLLRCLFYLFKKNGHSETKKFAQIISCLMQLRTVKELYHEAQEMLINDWAGKIELPPLLFEMWSS